MSCTRTRVITASCVCGDPICNPETVFDNLSVKALDSALCCETTGSSNAIVRLKSILAYLRRTVCLDVECCATNYVQRLPKNVKQYIYRELDRAGVQNIQYFYEHLMTSMAETLSMGITAIVAFKILIQMLAFKYPEATECCMAQMAVLRNTYECDEKICIRLLWGFSQAGYGNINVGLRIWLNLMKPVIHIANYSGYVCRYIAKIVADKALRCLNLCTRDFQLLIEALTRCYPICEEYMDFLQCAAQKIATYYVESCENLSVAFLVLLKNTNNRNIFIETIIECLWLDPTSVSAFWELILDEHPIQSGIILAYIDSHWPELWLCLSKIPAFFQFLNKIQSTSPVAQIAASIIEKLIRDNVEKTAKKVVVEQKKGAAAKSSAKSGKNGAGGGSKCSCCKWLFGSLALVLAIAVAINYDVHVHGGAFQKSATGKFLKDIGALPYVEMVWQTGMSNGARGVLFMQKNVPIYTQKTSSALQPYWEFSKDLTVVTWNGAKQGFKRVLNIVDEQSPVVVDFIEKYAPGLPAKIKATTIKTWVFISNSSFDIYQSSRQFVNEKVLVGKLSPENLHLALSQTKKAAADYCSWFHKKVEEYAKN